MRILALEAYYGGSHQAFIDDWRAHSQHQWHVLTLPATKWKWRMRHAAITFASELARPQSDAARTDWDVLLCSDMLNLAEFRGLADSHIAGLPAVVYFHENQLTYPVRFESERDYQYALTNFTTALAARAVWFNSAYHRDAFLDALTVFFRRMPDYHPIAQIDTIGAKSAVHPVGIDPMPARAARAPGPTRILWAARWEHDKNPEDFFAALDILQQRGLPFRISIIGPQFRQAPSIFEEARLRFAERMDHWGYEPDVRAYRSILQQADLVVSTARHEFFGIGLVEAVAAGARPLVPNRLAYPEVLGRLTHPGPPDEYLYDGAVEDLARKLAEQIERIEKGLASTSTDALARCANEVYAWGRLAPILDDALAKVIETA